MGLNTELKNNIKIIVLIVITLFVLYILHISIGGIFNSSQSGDKQGNFLSNIIFQEDLQNKSLTVLKIDSGGVTFSWSEISIVNGSAQLPEGTIGKGDIITQCEGHLELFFKVTGRSIWEGDFS